MHIRSDSTFKNRPKNCPINNVGMTDNRDRRFGVDRREFSYTAYLPERRSGKDRRRACDHRNMQTNESRSEIKNQQCHSGIMC
jgi:hypothetical protein